MRLFLTTLLLVALSGQAMAGWPATPDLRRVGRGDPVPTTHLATIVATGTDRGAELDAIRKAAAVTVTYTQDKGFEACARVCRAPNGRVGLLVTTNHAHVGCAMAEDRTACPDGFGPTQDTIHSHPMVEYVNANPVDVVFTRQRFRRGARLAVHPHTFSRQDVSNGSGYLALPTSLFYQSQNTGVVPVGWVDTVDTVHLVQVAPPTAAP